VFNQVFSFRAEAPHVNLVSACCRMQHPVGMKATYILCYIPSIPCGHILTSHGPWLVTR
jgi:hypothetical protein